MNRTNKSLDLLDSETIEENKQKGLEAERRGELEFERQLKELFKRPVEYTTEQAIKFISHKVNFGHPKTAPYSGRGARSKNTQYDLAYDRRKGFYHRLVRLPESGAKGRLNIALTTLTVIKAMAEQLFLNETPQRQRVSKLFKHIENNQLTLPQFERKTLYLYLKKLKYLPSN